MNTGRSWSEIAMRKEFLAGLLYSAFGLVAVTVGRDYRLGTASNMGPGYFPAILGALLLLVGVLCIARSWWSAGERVGRFEWRRLFIVVGSVALFAVLLPRVGLPVALASMALVSATASHFFRLSIVPLLGLLAVIGLCTLLFAHLLNVPLPVLGSWFDT